jgi:hypothetical protein
VAYVRKVRTVSGAVAVQVVRKHRGQWEILAHVGSAHTDAELGILLERARRIAAGDQEVLDIEVAACYLSIIFSHRPISAPSVESGSYVPRID